MRRASAGIAALMLAISLTACGAQEYEDDDDREGGNGGFVSECGEDDD